MNREGEKFRFSQTMREDFNGQYLRWREKWGSEYWDDSDSDAKRSFLDYAIDGSFAGRFAKHKFDDMDDEIPRISLLSETIDSLGRLNEFGTLNRAGRRAIEDFLLILAWYEDEDCARNDFWECLNGPEAGLEGVARKALEFLNEGVELRPFAIEISGREDVENVFGVSSFRGHIRKMVSDGRFVAPSGRFSTTAASSAISEKTFRCSDFVEEEIVKKIYGLDIEGKVSTFKVNCSRRQVLRMAEMTGWREPGRDERDSVNQHLEARMEERLREKRRWRKNAIRLSKLLGRRRGLDLASKWSFIEELRKARKESWKEGVDGRGSLMVHQQRYNTGNIRFNSPIDWTSKGRVLSTIPVYGHYRTEDYQDNWADLKTKDYPEGRNVPAKPSSWYHEMWSKGRPLDWGRYSGEAEEDGKLVIDTVIRSFLLNYRQRLSLSRHRERIDGFLNVESAEHRKARSAYPLFLPLGNAIRDIQNFWKEEVRYLTHSHGARVPHLYEWDNY